MHTWHDPEAATILVVPYIFTLRPLSFRFTVALSLFYMGTYIVLTSVIVSIFRVAFPVLWRSSMKCENEFDWRNSMWLLSENLPIWKSVVAGKTSKICYKGFRSNNGKHFRIVAHSCFFITQLKVWLLNIESSFEKILREWNYFIYFSFPSKQFPSERSQLSTRNFSPRSISWKHFAVSVQLT